MAITEDTDMSAKIFSYSLIIKEIYLDTFGHVNNAMYLTLLEEARWELLNENGYGLKKIQEVKQGPTIVEIRIKFLKELKPRDQVTIETQLISYQKKIGVLQQTINRDEEICCTAEIVFGLFDLKLRQLIEPTADWLKAIGVEINAV